MQTITVQAAALAVIEAAIPGVARAYAEAPDTIEGNLPAFVNVPGQSTWTCALYIAQRGEGIEGEIIRRCYPFFDLVRDALQGHQSLGGVKGVLKVTYQGDNGIAFERLKYQNLIYSGIVFRLQITSRVTSAIAPGE